MRSKFPSSLIHNLSLLCFVVSAALTTTPVSFAQTEEAIAQQDAESKAYFEKTHSALDDALAEFDDAQDAPDTKELAFYDFLSQTKESQAVKVEGYLETISTELKASNATSLKKKNEQEQDDLDVLFAPKKKW